MITSKSGGVIRVIQRFVTNDEYFSSFDTPIVMVPGVAGKVLQAVNCTVLCSPDQAAGYDRVGYIYCTDVTSPQMILVGTEIVGYSILSQTVNGAQFGSVLKPGFPLLYGAIDSNPSQGDGGMWVSLWYTIWPDKSGAF